MFAIHPRKTGGAPAWNDTVASFLRHWFEGAIRNWQRRKTVAALAALDDRLLLDIGLERGTLEDFADVLAERESWLSAPVVVEKSAPSTTEFIRRAA